MQVSRQKIQNRATYSPSELRNPKENIPPGVCQDGVTPSSSSPPLIPPPSASSPGRRQPRRLRVAWWTGSHIDRLAADLAALGFDGPLELILDYGYDRVKAALDRAKSRPQHKITNMAGYIRYLCRLKGPVAAADRQPDPNDRYISGKYGHLVRR